MASRPALLALLLPAASGCGGKGEVMHRTAGPEPLPPRFELVHEVRNATALRSFAWDGGTPTPAAFRTETTTIGHGALSPTADTLALLPFDEGAGDEVSDAAGRARVRVDGHRWSAGRFGSALVLDERSELEVRAAGGGDLLGAPFTVQLRLRPEGTRDATVLVAPGLFALELRGGRPRLRLDARGRDAALESEARVRPGEWTHVAVALGGPDLPLLRLVVGDAAAGLRLERPVRSGAPLLRVGPFAGAVDDLRVLSRAASSAELFEDGRPGAGAGEHELTLERGRATRTERLWTGVLREPELRADAEWRRGELVHAAPLEGRLVWTPAHWRRDRPASPPRSRTTHPTVAIGGGRAWIFGGETRDSHMGPMVTAGDTWIYHGAERRWEEVAGGPAPPPRCHQPAAYSPDHDVVLLAGGMRAEDGRWVLHDDSWIFDVAAKRWERREPSGVALSPMSDFGLVYHPPLERFVLIRGRWIRLYDPVADRWERRPEPPIVDEAGQEVDYRPGGSFMAGYDPETGLVVIFGGERRTDGGVVFQDALATYDPMENRFVVRATNAGPSPRVRSGFAYDSRRGRFLLFGGVRGERSERDDDLWSLDAATGTWRRLDASGAPSARGGYFGMAYDAGLDETFLVGGRHGYDRFLDETWRLRVDDGAVGTARYVFDRAAFPEASWFEAEWSAPAGGAVTFRFAGSPDGHAFSDWSATATDGVAAGDRFVKVEARLRAGNPELAPEILRMGFAGERTRGPAPPGHEQRSDPLAPLATTGTD